jgi:putative ABC transport system permease protein
LFGAGAAANTALTDALQQSEATGRPASVLTNYASATITVKDGSTPAQITQLKKALTDQGYSGQTVADRLGSFVTVINGIVGVLDAFAVIALIAAGFGIINTLLMSVQERTREIGLMKAMGMGGGRIYALFSLEAVFIGFLGSAIGAAVAIVIGSVVSGALSTTLLSALPGLNLLQFAPASVAVIILVVMGIAFLAGTLPARRASRQNPIDALRYE